MELKFDAIHVAAYVGALGSLLFGANQLRIILRKKEAKDISLFDYAARIVYSILLGVYSIGIGNGVFVVVNFGAALLSAFVLGAALMMKRKNAGDGESSPTGRVLPDPIARQREQRL
jgi:hypothetical protein